MDRWRNGGIDSMMNAIREFGKGGSHVKKYVMDGRTIKRLRLKSKENDKDNAPHPRQVR